MASARDAEALVRGVRPLLREALRAGGPWPGAAGPQEVELPWSDLEAAAPDLRAASADPIKRLVCGGILTRFLREAGIDHSFVSAGEGGLVLRIDAEDAFACARYVGGGTARAPAAVAAELYSRLSAGELCGLEPAEWVVKVPQVELEAIAPEFRQLIYALAHPGVYGRFGVDACLRELRLLLENAGVRVRVRLGRSGLEFARR